MALVSGLMSIMIFPHDLLIYLPPSKPMARWCCLPKYQHESRVHGKDGPIQERRAAIELLINGKNISCFF
jgi:hypothetical protein